MDSTQEHSLNLINIASMSMGRLSILLLPQGTTRGTTMVKEVVRPVRVRVRSLSSFLDREDDRG